MHNCDECSLTITSFGPNKDNGITSSATKSDIHIHPIYRKGSLKYNGTDQDHMTWPDKLYRLYNLALIKLQSSSIFGPEGIEPKKRQLNR